MLFWIYQVLETPTSSKCFWNRSTVLNPWTRAPLKSLSTAGTTTKVFFWSVKCRKLSIWPLPSLLTQLFLLTRYQSTICVRCFFNNWKSITAMSKFLKLWPGRNVSCKDLPKNINHIYSERSFQHLINIICIDLIYFYFRK